ncbi:MAG TPA: 4Fe-4S binding protein [Candidatus Limnocylindrales bacterium]|nr:4Fe-4S binding protein [Candidatus Limnocylindrales bacterium]
MAYVIAEPCVDHMDQSCVQVCPVDAISSEAGVDRKMFIDPAGCIECGSCMSVCPNGAIYPENQVPVDWIDYVWLDAAWYRDRDMTRSVLAEVLEEGVRAAAGAT